MESKMIFSLCRLSLGFSTLFVSMTVIGSDASAQVHQSHQPLNTSEAQTWLAQSRDYQTAVNLGMEAAEQCYQQKKIDECNNLQNIQNTLSTWCAENDQTACEAYNILFDYSTHTQSNEMQNDLIDQLEPPL
jgi:hypothetical protein